MSRNPCPRLIRAYLAAFLFLVAALLGARPAEAQIPPSLTVTFSPPSGTYSPGQLQVTIAWYAANGLNDSSRSIDYDGTVVVPFNYTKTGNGRATSVGTILIEPGGDHEITARICDLAANCRSGAAQYAGLSPSATVTAETPSVTVAAGTRSMIRYRVVNTASAATTFRMSASCPVSFAECAPSDSIVTVGAGATGWVDAEFLAPASGGGPVQLVANAGISFSGSATATVTSAADPGYPGDALSLLRIQRDACVTIATGNGTASECGDLRVAHALPSVRVLNKTRTPVLIYNSGHARPYPVVAAQFAGPAGAAVDSITAMLTVNGTVLPSQRWVGWGPQQTRRISVSFDATAYRTGLYNYTLTVVAKRAGGPRDTLPVSRSGRMIIVNRASSAFGAGWWLAGVERLELNDLPGDTLKLWVGGDGSARLYRGSPGGPWRADGYDRPDSLYRPAGTSGYTRTLAGGARVHFDSAGLHVRTENALGQPTVFNWVQTPTEKRLVSIVLPFAPGHPEQLSYQFEYGTMGPGCTTATTGLSRVRSPAAAVGTYSDTWLCGDALRRVTRIRDASPDTTSVAFGYAAGNGWMTSRTDRMGVTQTLGYRRVRFYNAVQPVRAGVNATTWVIAAETHGVNGTASTSADSVRVVFDGPRPGSDVCDCAWWHVDRYGAPVDMRNAAQQVTTLRRGDGRWPGRVTETVAPNGFTSTAVYDSRGDLVSTTAWNPYGDGRNSTTTFQWDTAAAAPTRVVSPEGVVSTMGYDRGRRAWEQVGPDTARRVGYVYNAMTHATAPGQLERIVYSDSTAERLEYDARGNLSATVSPMGARSELESDRLGRVSVQRVAIDTVAGQLRFQGDSTYYDAAGRVRRVASFAPSLQGEDSLRAVVVNDYDREGRLTALSRTSVPDPNFIGTITTRWEYDLAGRRIVEIAPDSTPTNALDNPRDSTFYDLAGNVERVRTRRFAEILAVNPVTITNPHAPYTRMRYDHLNRLIERITPQVRYDSIEDGLALRGYIYPHENTRIDDAFPNRNRALPYPWHPNVANWGYRISGDTASFAYDTNGNLLRADNRDAWIRRSYYPGGALRGDTLKIRTVLELYEGGNDTSHVYGLEHMYDRAGRRTELKHPGNIAPSTAGTLQDRARFTFDAVTGALETVTDPLSNTFRYHYSRLGQLDSLSMPGLLRDVYEYDRDGRLARHQTRNGSTTGVDRYAASLLRDERYRYDARGKLLFSGNAAGAGDTTFVTYTGLGHMYRDSVRSRGMPASVYGVRYAPLSNAVQAVRHDALGNLTGVRNASTFELPWRKDTSVNMAFSQYESGTGRLLATDDGYGFDLQRYDRGGNVVFSETDSLKGNPSAVASLRDKAMFYGADRMLRAAETRVVDNRTTTASTYRRSFEEYRYDALGRRVWVRARRDCHQGFEGYCELGWVRRTVWDGNRELYEIQAPSSENGYFDARREFDAQPVELVAWGGNPGDGTDIDPNPFYGRVAYTYGAAIDQPLSVIRMGYGDIRDTLTAYGGSTYRAVEPFAVIPLWNTRGQAGLGAFADGTWRKCETAVWSSGGQPRTRCIKLSWPELWAGYARPQMFRDFWHGTLLQDKQDASGLNFRRNRYYDPATGRFTQEDPIGLAGGLNLYGFGDGDPVNHDDPFGLKVCFAGTAAEVGALRSAAEGATGAAIFLDKNNCVSAVGTSMSRDLRGLRDRMDLLRGREETYTVGFTGSETFQGSRCWNPGTHFCNEDLIVEIDQWDVWNRTDPAKYWACWLIGGVGAGPKVGHSGESILAHELLGHAWAYATGQDHISERIARRAENVFRSRDSGGSSRCGG